PPTPPLFPYTTLFRSNTSGPPGRSMNPNPFASLNHFTFPVSAMSTTSSLSGQNPRERRADDRDQAREPHRRDPRPAPEIQGRDPDRKSTRLNSSHVSI